MSLYLNLAGSLKCSWISNTLSVFVCVCVCACVSSILFSETSVSNLTQYKLFIGDDKKDILFGVTFSFKLGSKPGAVTWIHDFAI